MVDQHGTKQQKKQEAVKTRENAFQRTIRDRNSGSTYHTAAQRQGLPGSSVWHRQHGRKSRAEAHEHRKKLSSIEEKELRDGLKELDDWGIHLSHAIIVGRANDVLQEREPVCLA
ncbi:hypothetical protein K435DRAFT_868280 [Dendrothele bispora CBS 962.96]|uniref:Uncharacterized protein n=1 Tax=Dendrothele bispora (strain CBS 962.96) TaxID=1314807 RepID=A0A4S8LCV8_DENBC|nr:hypothetical protein K435DRAFT_868280 [Dendrothele bispora CBS 962.96]